jgi:hypothetical protein
MANLSQGGFWPEVNAGSATTQTKRVRIASNNATAIFLGDCLKFGTAAGVWGLATAGGGISGVSQGASYYDSGQFVRKEAAYLPASTTYSSTAFDMQGETDMSFVYTTSDPVSTRYRCEYSASTVALTDLTKNANFVATAGSTTSGISGHRLNQGTIAANAALDLMILDVKRNVLNDPTLTAAKVIVQINVTDLPGSAGFAGT